MKKPDSTTKTRASRRDAPPCSMWVILDGRERRPVISSGMVFTSLKACHSYCQLPGDKPFEVYVVSKPRRTSNKEINQ